MKHIFETSDIKDSSQSHQLHTPIGLGFSAPRVLLAIMCHVPILWDSMGRICNKMNTYHVVSTAKSSQIHSLFCRKEINNSLNLMQRRKKYILEAYKKVVGNLKDLY